MPTPRTDPPLVADEQTMLRAWLDYHRDTLRLKTEGLSQDQLNTRLEPSTLTLGQLLKHMALVESSWFSRVLRGEPMMPPFDTAPWDDDVDWEMTSSALDTPEELRALLDESVARADAILDEAFAGEGLDQLSARPSRDTGEPFSLRWIVMHMIEEYARHNGHADLIRESVDGQTGE